MHAAARSVLLVGVFTLYAWTAAPTAYWLDSSELAAAAFELSIPHPPGHPLFVILGKLATLVPIGSIAFRVHALCALLVAIALALLVRISTRLWGTLALTPALIVSATLALSIPFWLHGVRAEVYPLHLVLAIAVIGAAVHAGESRGKGSWALLGFATGLALANHHYLTVFMAPAVLWLLFTRRPRALITRLGLALTGVILGTLPYLLLTIRSAAFPTVRWGQADSFAGTWWIVTAQAFQKTAGRVSRLSVLEALERLWTLLDDSLGPIWLALAAAGLVLALMRRTRLALAVVLLLVFNLVSQVLFDFDPTNPDVSGYFLLSFSIVGLMAAGVPAWLLARFSFQRERSGAVGGPDMPIAGAHEGKGPLPDPPGELFSQPLPGLDTHLDPGHGRRRKFRPLGRALVIVLTLTAAALSLWLTLPRSVQRCNLAHFRDTDHFARAIDRVAPTNALVVTGYHESIFNLWYRDVTECWRPDLAVIHHLFRNYPGYDEYLRFRYPELSDLLVSERARTDLSASGLLERAAGQAILVEIDATLDPELERYLLPAGLLQRLSPFPVPTRPWPKWLEDADRRFWRELMTSVHPENRETLGNLLWNHFHRAWLLARQGQWSASLDALYRAIDLSPRDPDLLGFLDRLLEQPYRYSIWPKSKDPSVRASPHKPRWPLTPKR